MADFGILTLCISLNSSQMCAYFCKDLVTGYWLYLVKILFPTVIRFQIDFIIHTLLLWAWPHVKFVYMAHVAKFINVSYNFNAQRIMVKTTWKLDRSWSGIFA